jgi:uncharacterized alpha-E superfamily protein
MSHYTYPSYIPTYPPTYYVATQPPSQLSVFLDQQQLPGQHTQLHSIPTPSPYSTSLYRLPDVSDNASIISNINQLNAAAQQNTRKNTVCSYWCVLSVVYTHICTVLYTNIE